jgi:hypothetical protein
MQVMAVMTALPQLFLALDTTSLLKLWPAPPEPVPSLGVVDLYQPAIDAGGLPASKEGFKMDTYDRSGFVHRDIVQKDDIDWEDDTDPVVKRRREAAKAAEKEELDDKLDIALEDSFPGSDPISIAQPPQSPYEKSKF